MANYSSENIKFIYLRKATTLGADDDNDNGSVCVPASSITSMHPSTDTELRIMVTSRMRYQTNNTSASDASAATSDVINNDIIDIAITANTHKDVMKAITNKINDPYSETFITIADNVTSEYLPNVTGVNAISAAVLLS